MPSWIGLLFSLPVYAITAAYLVIQAQNLLLNQAYTVNTVQLFNNQPNTTTFTMNTGQPTELEKFNFRFMIGVYSDEGYLYKDYGKLVAR
jgi:hypothetical protein